MLIPAGVSAYEALASLRKEVKELEKGIWVSQVNEQGKVEQIFVQAAISCLIGDHPQSCEYARHIGVTAKRNCRFCHVTADIRIDSGREILEYNMTRRKEETNTIRAQLDNAAAQQQWKPSVLKKLPTAYGIGFKADMFEGLTCDPHLQSFPEPEHLFDLGLIKHLLDYIIFTPSQDKRNTIAIRLRDLQFPRGWSKLSTHMILGKKKKNGKVTQPMNSIRKVQNQQTNKYIHTSTPKPHPNHTHTHTNKQTNKTTGLCLLVFIFIILVFLEIL
jgi:hypothetical protein